MSDVLCVYYSRTGRTKEVIEEMARELDAEVVLLRDGVDRSGPIGWLRSGCDAMRRTTAPLKPFETEKGLSQYRLVIVASPVWAGRVSSVVRSFLKQHGKKLRSAAFLLTRGSED